MQLIINSRGQVRCVYQEAINLSHLGRVSIKRASHVEPVDNGLWNADLAPVGGPVLGPFANRSAALLAESEWLAEHWLNQ